MGEIGLLCKIVQFFALRTMIFVLKVIMLCDIVSLIEI